MNNKTKIKYFLLSLFIVGLIGTGINLVSAARTGSFWKRSGDGLTTNPSTLTIGSELNPISAGYFTTLNASTSEITNLTISGASAGDLDMGGYAITNSGLITGTSFSATSTTDTSTFAGGLEVGGTASRITFNNDEYIESPSDGLIKFSGDGGTNNENFSLDFETTANEANITTSSGLNKFDFNSIGLNAGASTIAGIGLNNGSVGAPSLYFDADTGIYSRGENIFDIVAGGVPKISLYNGKIGFNERYPQVEFHVTTDQNDFTELRIDNTNAGADVFSEGLTLYDGSTSLKAYFKYNNFSDVLQVGKEDNNGRFDLMTNNTERMTILNSGFVGIGTTNPTDLLQIHNNTATSTLYITSGGTELGGEIIIEDIDGAGCTEITTLNGAITGKIITCPTN